MDAVAVAAVTNRMKLILDTSKKELEVIEDTKLSDLLSFIDRNELDDYKIVSYKTLTVDKEIIKFPYSYPLEDRRQVGPDGVFIKLTPKYYKVDWINETITSTTY